jgi:hypothetical protein
MTPQALQMGPKHCAAACPAPVGIIKAVKSKRSCPARRRDHQTVEVRQVTDGALLPTGTVNMARGYKEEQQT